MPDAPVDDFFVKHCQAVEKQEALESQPLCEAVLLMEADRIDGGIYEEPQIEAKYEKLAEEEAK